MFSIFDLLVLTQLPNIGPQRLRTLISHFGDPAVVCRAPAKEIAALGGFNRNLASSVAAFFRGAAADEARRFAALQLSRLEASGGSLLTYWDPGYPELLKRIYDPPPLLFMNGRFTDSDQYALAVVGTRSPSEYGRRCTELLCEEIVRLGITVVSGLARGIDTAAHSAVVRNEGRTIAVIGSGIDVIYPPENKALGERISACGAVVSECPMSAKPEAANFPRRNRLISGLALGTIVVESDAGGGAMITAQLALDQNREVFAVPGPIFSKRSRGCNMLIREGKAKLVETLDEVLCELSNKLPMVKPVRGRNRMLPQMSVFEQSIYDILSEEADHIDALAERSRQTASDTLVNLLSLECKGLVKQLPGKMFIKI